MDIQILLNLVFTGGGCLIGFVLSGIRASLQSLQEQDAKLCEKVQQLQVQVAGGYVTKEQLGKDMRIVFEKLERIDDKLDLVPCKQIPQYKVLNEDK